MNIYSIKEFYKYLVIGCGPAGLQCGYYLHHKYNQEYLILESNSVVGSFFSKYPRLKNLISINKTNNYTFDDELYDTMRYDWNSLLTEGNTIRLNQFTDDFYPKSDDFIEYLKFFSCKLDLNILFEINVLSISKSLDTDFFEITCSHPSYSENFIIVCEYLIIATGLKEKSIPESIIKISEELKINLLSYSSFDLNLNYFKNKNIIIIGTGNAAFETANYINKVSSSIAIIGPSKLAWRTHYPGHLRSINMGFLDSFYLKMGNNMYLDKYDTINAIKVQNDFLRYCNAKVDIIIYCGGFECNFINLFNQNIKPNILSNNYPNLTPWYESINIKNLYFAGALTHGDDYKKGTSGFIHGFRYNIEFTMRYINNDINNRIIISKDELIKHIIRRLNFCSCLHHRHGYYCDYIIIDTENRDTIFYYEKLHRPYLENIFVPKNSIQIELMFCYGKEEFDWNLKQPGSFTQPDVVIPFRNDISSFLHPVFNVVFRNGKRNTYHVGESPSGQFFHPIYTNYVKAIIDLSYTNITLNDICQFEKKIIDIHYSFNP